MYALPAGLEFERVLGRGATGTVVLARQVALDRRVAVKIISGQAPAGAVERLRREARVLAGLDHPNILPVYQLHQDQAAIALVMRYEPLGDLGSALPQLSGGRRVDVLVEVAAGLRAAHGAGVVHRDLKPANVLIGTSGRAVLADFGLARLPRGAAGFRTERLVVTGTPLYLAPEQIVEPQLESPAIDHYAFGVLAYRFLLDRWPYADPTWNTVHDLHLHATPVDPRSMRPDLDPDVARTLVALLAQDPRRRPSATEAAELMWSVPSATWDALIPAAEPAPQPVGSLTVLPEVGETVGTTTSSSDGQPEGAHPPPGQAILVRSGADAAPDRGQADGAPGGWIVEAVYSPPRQRATLRIVGLLLLGVLLGTLGYLGWIHR